MANKQLENRAISLFCENMAMLLGAGISAEEAAGLLAEDSAEGLQQAAAAIQKHLLVQGARWPKPWKPAAFTRRMCPKCSRQASAAAAPCRC